MKSQEFEKIINNSYVKERQAVYEKLKQKLDIPDAAPDVHAESRTAEYSSVATKKPASKRRTSFKNFFKKPARIAACVSVAAAVACLAIILPFTLKCGEVPSEVPTQKGRYFYAASCKENKIKYSLKEYSAINNLSLLYVDWYDIAEIKTSLHVNKEDQTDIVYYEEVLKHKGTGSIAELYISDWHTKVDIVQEYSKTCKNLYISTKNRNTKVLWGYQTVNGGEDYTYTAWIPKGYYSYVLVLRFPLNEKSIFELIDLVLSVK